MQSLLRKVLTKFFVNIGINLANKIPQCDLTFKSYLPKVNTTLNETVLMKDKFQEVFKSLNRSKALGHDGLEVNIITCVYELIKKPLLKIFNESTDLGIFLENMKIAKVAPIFKSGKKELLRNYRPISLLSCFSKTSERIMHNGVYNYLKDNSLLFHKQFGFLNLDPTKSSQLPYTVHFMRGTPKTSSDMSRKCFTVFQIFRQKSLVNCPTHNIFEYIFDCKLGSSVMRKLDRFHETPIFNSNITYALDTIIE